MEKIGIISILQKGKISKNQFYKEKTLTTPQKIVLMLEELGPTFIKLGQILSTRPDIVPGEYIIELKKLQDNVPGFDYEKAKEQIESEFKCSMEDIFLKFEKQPIAAASIGQVHRAVFKTGQDVVVKVQRPDIDRLINTDLEILIHLARLLEKHIPESRIYDPVGIVEEFADAIRKELDFTREGWNIERFCRNFEGDETIYVPKVYWDATTQKVLTIEYINGVKVNQFDKISELGLDRKEIAENGARLIMKQIFIHGFFHGDPHPGNIFICPDGKISFIDFGMMGRINEFTKHRMADLIIGVINRDSGKIIKTLLDIGLVSKEIELEKFQLDIEDMVEYYYGKTLKQIKISKLINELLAITVKYKIKLPSNFTLLCKSVLTIEGIGRGLDPDFDIIKVAKPFIKKMLQERYRPQYLVNTILKNLTELNQAVLIIPKILNEMFQKIKADSIKIDFEYNGLEKAVLELHRMINRLVFSMIIASIIIGSSLIIQANVSPKLYNLPILGIVGFTVAGLLGMGLVISILRSGRM
jgi:ubiquinone biosynthesis protein